MDKILDRLASSRFRGSFSLDAPDVVYIRNRGLRALRGEAFTFVKKRLAPGSNPNGGRQTPYRGHPVFKAQHATATCCRKCAYKWHGIDMGKDLSSVEIDFIVDLIMGWIEANSAVPEGRQMYML